VRQSNAAAATNAGKEERVETPRKLDIEALVRDVHEDWRNFVAAEVNDHVLRVSVLRRDFHWHVHTKSDEVFYVVRGTLCVDFEDLTEELRPGQMITVPKGVRHRTRGSRVDGGTVALCFEAADNDVLGDDPALGAASAP
jgi:mannose-6-phosphate isomerase-like protein (cupin superfamily)